MNATTSTGEFRETSTKFHTSLPKELRQEQGIFFTPKKVRDLLFAKLAALGVRPRRILEPSFGSGEFLLDARRIYPEAALLGVEKNADLFKSVVCPGADLTCCDFLEWNGTADVILGNPPYSVMKIPPKEKKAFSAKYSAAMTGRPNLAVLFLFTCLASHLEEGGVLAFILPTSLYNCSYYQSMRNYLHAHAAILHLETLETPGFYETGQETMLLILQKGVPSNAFIYERAGNVYLSPFAEELNALTQGTTTLAALGLGVKTGSVVWNQVKEKLSDTPGTLLVYSSNVRNSSLVLGSLGRGKKQYLVGLDKPTLTGPLLLIERGYGNSLRLNSVFVRDLAAFYAENHLNVIYPKTPASAHSLERVFTSLQDPRSLAFVQRFIGNGSLSATDLETVLPVF